MPPQTSQPPNEAETCERYITPALHRAGWDPMLQVRREYGFTDGRVIVRGQLATRGQRRRADYLLFFGPNLPLAVIEAKDPTHSLGAGIQQALAYAETLDLPFAFASNGAGFVFHDRTVGSGPNGTDGPVERTLTLDEFPSPADLWQRYRAWKGLSDDTEKLARFPYHDDASGKEPRYYQRIAIQRVIEAVAAGDRRQLLVMATGTGKTYTAFQIIWRLWKAGVVKRVLFLADRNILVDQTMTNDFKPFGPVMTKVQNRTIDKSFEVYLALYQAITGTEPEQQIFRQFSPDFFDLIIVDECHRGSARDNSAWRDILDWFSSSIQLGLTATPKETSDISTQTYFGEPIYTYSLKQGIDDGFLAPYKVVRIDFDKDLFGWRPPVGTTDDAGVTVEDRVYNQRDMDRALILPLRTRAVARKIVDYLHATDPWSKTIVFCEDIDHAERMRSALVNEFALRPPPGADDIPLFKQIVRITGDSDDGKRALDDFIHPEKRLPIIATTSKLLTTGVDAKTCRLIVLDQRIESLIEFKQIVGRGTRIHEDTGKLWFTVMDFKRATELFADPDFDGDPVVIYEPGPDEPVDPPDPEGDPPGEPDPGPGPTGPGPGPGPGPDPGRPRHVVSGVDVAIIGERVQYYDANGRLITESLKDHTRHTLRAQYASLDDFLRRWSAEDKKNVILDELKEQGVLLDALREHADRDLDPFDLICHIVYDQPPLTRQERANNVRKRDVFTRFGGAARAVLDALLDKYADQGVVPNDIGVLRVHPIADLGTPVELVNQFGGKDGYLTAVRAIERELYRVVS